MVRDAFKLHPVAVRHCFSKSVYIDAPSKLLRKLDHDILIELVYQEVLAAGGDEQLPVQIPEEPL